MPHEYLETEHQREQQWKDGNNAVDEAEMWSNKARWLKTSYSEKIKAKRSKMAETLGPMYSDTLCMHSELKFYF